MPVFATVVTHVRVQSDGMLRFGRYLILIIGLPVLTLAMIGGTAFVFHQLGGTGHSLKAEYVHCDLRESGVARATVVLMNNRTDALFVEKNEFSIRFEAGFPAKWVELPAEVVGSSKGVAPVYILPVGERVWLTLESKDARTIASIPQDSVGLCKVSVELTDQSIRTSKRQDMIFETPGTVDRPSRK